MNEKLNKSCGIQTNALFHSCGDFWVGCIGSHLLNLSERHANCQTPQRNSHAYMYDPIDSVFRECGGSSV